MNDKTKNYVIAILLLLVLGYFSSLVVGVVIAKKSINHALRTDIDNDFAIKFMNQEIQKFRLREI